MSNDKPNAELFNLPLKLKEEYLYSGGKNWFVVDSEGNIILDHRKSFEEAEAIVRSINEHDRLAIEIRKVFGMICSECPCEQSTKKELLELILSIHKEIDDFLNKEVK